MIDPFTNQLLCDCQLDLEGLGRYSDIDCGAPRLTSAGLPRFAIKGILPAVGPKVIFIVFLIFSFALCSLLSLMTGITSTEKEDF